MVCKRLRRLARNNPTTRRIEMHLRSTRAQTVNLRAAGVTLTLQEDETIWTESCHKYAPEEVPRLAAAAGFHCEAQWLDHEWPFAENLLIAD
jgi:L-histidine Nalpha-methyltransferase